MPSFTTTLLQSGNNVGIGVPDEIVDQLGAGKRAPVVVTLHGYTYRSTLGVMGGETMISLSKAHREAAGVAGGEEHEVTVEHDTAPRDVVLPGELAAALDDAGVREAFDALAPSYRKEHVRAVTEAKAEATRERRIAKVVDGLR